ncbi:MAG: hypothetical protein HZB79_03930 [Deltaproteobacteria bacterium]|nr:hypothetical protein [Deltaproteobacteria bacterium]
MKEKVKQQAQRILDKLLSDTKIGSVIDDSNPTPDVFCGTGEIQIIILGQDLTVKDEQSRKSITTVLNLDKSGNLKRYIEKICGYLDITLDENIYATNYFKNFFIQPPTIIKNINIFREHRLYWLDLLKEELAQFPTIPIITLGEPLLETILKSSQNKKVRTYWGYNSDWKTSIDGPFQSISPKYTYLERKVFPFPHQPSIRKKFYYERLEKYATFVKSHMTK